MLLKVIIFFFYRLTEALEHIFLLRSFVAYLCHGESISLNSLSFITSITLNGAFLTCSGYSNFLVLTYNI